MALPNTLDPTTPIGTTTPLPSQISSIKQYLIDALGFPNGAALTSQVSSVTAAGLLTISQSPLAVPTVVQWASGTTGQVRSVATQGIVFQTVTNPIFAIMPTGIDLTAGGLSVAGTAGSSGQILQSQGLAVSPLWVTSIGFRFLGASDAEATTTSGTITNLKSLSGLNVATTSSLVMVFTFRKAVVTPGEAMYIRFGLNGSSVTGERAVLSSTNTGGSGQAVVVFGPRSANHLKSMVWASAGYDGVVETGNIFTTEANSVPNAAITSVQIDARNGAGVTTVGVANVKLYELIGA